MSKQKETPTQKSLTPEQKSQQIFSQLSSQFKAPLRNIMGEAEEAVQNTISNLIQQLIQINNSLTSSNNEVMRLRELCTKNKIDFGARPPNRAERRANERKQDKKAKSSYTLEK